MHVAWKTIPYVDFSCDSLPGCEFLRTLPGSKTEANGMNPGQRRKWRAVVIVPWEAADSGGLQLL